MHVSGIYSEALLAHTLSLQAKEWTEWMGKIKKLVVHAQEKATAIEYVDILVMNYVLIPFTLDSLIH